MPHEVMDVRQIALYLHMDEREVRKLASRGKIPCRRQGDDYAFRKSDVDQWVESQLRDLPNDRLAQIEAGVRRHHGLTEEGLVVAPMIPPGGVAVPLTSRTKQSTLRDLVALGDKCGLVYAPDTLLAAIVEREELCSTAILPEVALPHPRHPAPYDIAESFIVVGRSDNGIPFGAQDGSLTRLFFLICCKDDRTHLHVLARLGRLLHDERTVQQLLDATDAGELLRILDERERNAIAGRVDH